MIPSFTLQKLLLVLGDVALILLATYLSPLIRLGHASNVLYHYTGATTFTLFLYLVMLYIFDLYNVNRDFTSRDSALRIAMAVMIAGFLAAFLFYSLPRWRYGRGIFLIQIITVWLLVLGWRRIFSLVFPGTVAKERILIVGAGRCSTALYELLKSRVSPYKVVGFLDDDEAKLQKTVGSPAVLGTTDQLIQIAARRKVKTAIVAITHNRPKRLIHGILEAKLKGINIVEMPMVFEGLTRRVPVEHIHDEWLLFAGGFYLISKEYLQKVKRLIDLAFSTVFLTVSLPVLGIVALAIRLDSKGPIFYKQNRIGKGGSEFSLWKFRSMVANAEEKGVVWAKENDKRVTRVGKVLRLLRIDEIPQLFNVLRGEMSLIGPRPERPEFVKELETQVPYYLVRHTVRPGITGWAQVNYRYGASAEDALRKLEYDLYYIKNMSLLLDLKILLKTIGVVIFGQGAR
ncbi:MAG: sugar transferase [Thermodesulfobacteriota bacterium]